MKLTVTTLTALARELKINKSSATRLRQRDDWPVSRNAPWTRADVKRLREWRETLQEDRATAPSTAALTRARTEATAELALARRHMREMREGAYHRADECQARMIRCITDARTRFMSLPGSLAPRLVGQSEIMIRATLDDALRGILNELAHGTGAATS